VKASRYLSACAFAGPWLDSRASAVAPTTINRAMPPGPLRAVYVVCDWGGRILYVGSTAAGVRNRIRQHCTDAERTRDWAEVWVIPLRDDTPVTELRRLEGLIGLALRPIRNRSLPAAGKYRSRT
jgi:hypothetical protein